MGISYFLRTGEEHHMQTHQAVVCREIAVLLHSPFWKPVHFNNPNPSGMTAAVCMPALWPDTSVQESGGSSWSLAQHLCSLQLLLQGSCGVVGAQQV